MSGSAPAADTDPPIVSKADANASPILTVTVQSSNRDLMQLSEYANNVVKEQLQAVPGVSSVRIWGEKNTRSA
ncbi:MAG: efflux RND transporter permease subunit [Haliscomenobacter sp.]|nr:efflux RND transporter permease subunit [Haliscomenobacter sp.]